MGTWYGAVQGWRVPCDGRKSGPGVGWGAPWGAGLQGGHPSRCAPLAVLPTHARVRPRPPPRHLSPGGQIWQYTQDLAHHAHPHPPLPPAGGQICQYAEDFGARCVVLLHHGRRSMMREMQYGAITSYCTKYCSRPLVVLDAKDALASQEMA